MRETQITKTGSNASNMARNPAKTSHLLKYLKMLKTHRRQPKAVWKVFTQVKYLNCLFFTSQAGIFGKTLHRPVLSALQQNIGDLS